MQSPWRVVYEFRRLPEDGESVWVLPFSNKKAALAAAAKLDAASDGYVFARVSVDRQFSFGEQPNN